MNCKNIFIFFSACSLLFGCGIKLPPEALFATSPTNIDSEITRRKNEEKKLTESENVTSTKETKDKTNPQP